MKGHTEAVGIERREFALNGDGVGWMGLLKNEYFARWGRRSRDVSSESRSHKNLVAPPRSQYAPVERDLSVIDIEVSKPEANLRSNLMVTGVNAGLQRFSGWTEVGAGSGSWASRFSVIATAPIKSSREQGAF